MGYRILILSLFTFALGFSVQANDHYPTLDQDQDGKKANQRDNNGKQGHWIYYGKDKPQAGYPMEGKIEEGPFLDDRKEGIWLKYQRDGITPRLQGTYTNNRPQGAYIKFHSNGKIKEAGTFERNAYKDSLKRFHENGVMEFEVKYNQDGREEGTVKFYYPNGQLEFEYKAVNGRPVGPAKRFYENGDIKELITYGADGKVVNSERKERVKPAQKVIDPGASEEKAPSIARPRTKGAKFAINGYNKIYNSNDEIWQDGTFRNGQLWDGKVYEYDTDGIMLRVKVFKLGVYHSDGQL
jgi:antitoxin component YwqK of YwqJK toxin-antitoxin module